MQAPPPGYSNYPRYEEGPRPVPPGPPQVRFDAIAEGWALMREDWGTWVLASLIVALVYFAVAFPLTFGINLLAVGNIWGPQYGDARYWPLQIIEALISQGVNMCFTAGMLGLCLRRLRGETYTYSDLFAGFPRFFTFLGAGLLSSFVIMVGAVFCIIPGLYLAGALAFTPLVVLDQKAGAIEAFQISYATLSRHGLAMFAIMFITGLLVGLGFLACCVGVLFTIPVYFFVIAIHYHAFFPPQGGPEVVPSATPQYSV
jgi:hypothetical protein